MLSTNSAPWPIASSHQHQRNPYHALQYDHYYSTLCTMHAAASLTYCSNSLRLVTSSHFIDELPRLPGRQGLPALACPALSPESLTVTPL